MGEGGRIFMAGRFPNIVHRGSGFGNIYERCPAILYAGLGVGFLAHGAVGSSYNT